MFFGFNESPIGPSDVREIGIAVDRGLSRLYRTAEFRDAYVKWFGEVDADTATFFRLSALPE